MLLFISANDDAIIYACKGYRNVYIKAQLSTSNDAPLFRQPTSPGIGCIGRPMAIPRLTNVAVSPAGLKVVPSRADKGEFSCARVNEFFKFELYPS